MIYTTLVMLLVIAAFLVALDRKDRRHAEALTALVSQASPDLTALQALVTDLCQRIQAPQLATTQHAYGEQEYAPPAIGMDDDQGFFEAKEALAERTMMQELRGTS